MSNKFDKYIKKVNEDGEATTSSGDVATFAKPIGDGLKKRKKPLDDCEYDEDGNLIVAEDDSGYDLNDDGKISADDVKYMVDGLSRNALIEIIDLVASYLEHRFGEPGDVLPSDGIARQYVREEVIRKVEGNKVIHKSSLPGFKCTVDGREVRMSDKDAKARVMRAIEVSKRRRARLKGNGEIPGSDGNNVAISMVNIDNPTSDIEQISGDTLVKKV